MWRALLFLLPLLLPAQEPAFSHQRHAGLNLPCTFCHPGAASKARAGFPAWKTCQTCHREKAEAKLPTQRVYRLPDFVFFSHAKHAGAKVECASCHGDMKSQSKVEIHRSTKMADCVDCHKEQQATITCTACHELGQ